MPFVRVGSSAGRARSLRGASVATRGRRSVLPDNRGERESLPPSVNPLCRVRWLGWQVVQIQWLLRGVCWVWAALGGLGSFCVGVVVGRIRFQVGRGAVLGGRLGSGVERPVGGAAIPGGGVVRAWGVAGRWGRVEGSGCARCGWCWW